MSLMTMACLAFWSKMPWSLAFASNPSHLRQPYIQKASLFVAVYHRRSRYCPPRLHKTQGSRSIISSNKLHARL